MWHEIGTVIPRFPSQNDCSWIKCVSPPPTLPDKIKNIFWCWSNFIILLCANLYHTSFRYLSILAMQSLLVTLDVRNILTSSYPNVNHYWTIKTFKTRLENESRVGTPILWNLTAIHDNIMTSQGCAFSISESKR